MPSAPTSQRRYDDSQIFFRCYHAMTNPDYCNSNVNGDPCCTRRILHVEPFVQPTLLENWVTFNRPISLYYSSQKIRNSPTFKKEILPTFLFVSQVSAIFEFGGRNPAVFDTIKNTMSIGIIVLVAMLWYYLGISLGIIPSNTESVKKLKNNDFKERIDLDTKFTGKFDIVKDEHLLDQLQKSIESESSLKGSKEFLCCLVSKNPLSKKYDMKYTQDNEVVNYNKLRCYGISQLKSNPSEFHKKMYSRKIARLNSATTSLDCENGNLVYQLSISNK